MTDSWTEAREDLRRADARFGDRWWAPIGYVLVLLVAPYRRRR